MRSLLLYSTVVIGALSSGCEVISHNPTSDLNGVYRGVLSDAQRHDAQQVHVLDGLALGFGLDSDRSLSATIDGVPQGLDLELQQRNTNGLVEKNRQMRGFAQVRDRIEADSLNGDTSLSLFYAATQSDEYPDLDALAGLYSFQRNSFQISLSVFADGRIEGYDNLGCGYFGDLVIPDFSRNLYSVSLTIEGCADASDYAYGIASAEFFGFAAERLILPLWFDPSDRVETWILRRS